MIFGKHVNKYYLRYAHYFLIGLIALIAVDWFQLRIPEIFGAIIDGLKEETMTRMELARYMQDILWIVLIMFFGRFLWRVTIFGNGVRIETDIRDSMFKHSATLSQQYYQENKIGAMMALYTNDLQTVRAAFAQGTIMLIDALFLGGLAFYKMIKLDIWLTLLSTIPLLLIALCGGIIGRHMQRKFSERQKAYADMTDFTQESFSGITVIKAFVKEAKELLAFSNINQKNVDKNITYVKTAMKLQILIGLLIGSVSIIILGYGGYLVFLDPNRFTIGNLMTYLAYFGTLTWPMMAIAALIYLRSQGVASLKRINGLLNQKADIIDVGVNQNSVIEGKITFQNLVFSYPNSSRNALDGISFTIQKGESVGIIGRTGSGKTTLVDLLLRIYNVEENSIFLDDQDIMKIPFKTVREHIAYVPQDNFLFSDTIERNIAFSKDTYRLEEVAAVARLADVAENIESFQEGYQTVLGERGVTISGGQKQRTSIARALMKEAPILILDDSVSAVDTKTEEVILQHLKETRKGKTTILIAHRISTVQHFSKIALLDQGKLIGFGTHEEMMKVPMYKKMVQLQALEDEIEGAKDEKRE